MLAVMIGGTALVLWIGPAWPTYDAYDPQPSRPLETPWLTNEAAAQIVGPYGTLGPLFDGVALGGPAPSRETRDRIAAFARANQVGLDLEVVAGTLVAVRFDVKYGGCCGYEGADVLALRMQRPQEGHCGGPRWWINDWLVTSESGITLRAQVRVNRVKARWERTATVPELLDRADRLLGMRTSEIDLADDHWNRNPAYPDRYTVEMPFSFAGYPIGPQRYDHQGLKLRAERGAIVEVSLVLGSSADPTEIEAIMKPRWGRARRITETTWTWRTSDRVVTVEHDQTEITIATR
jgi:hypothetical protein